MCEIEKYKAKPKRKYHEKKVVLSSVKPDNIKQNLFHKKSMWKFLSLVGVWPNKWYTKKLKKISLMGTSQYLCKPTPLQWFLMSFSWSRWVGNHPQEVFAKFGNKSHIQVAKVKNSSIPTMNYDLISKYGDLTQFSLKTWWSFLNKKIILWPKNLLFVA
jgi:hypothetical protein